jgi:hypothetical protein
VALQLRKFVVGILGFSWIENHERIVVCLFVSLLFLCLYRELPFGSWAKAENIACLTARLYPPKIPSAFPLYRYPALPVVLGSAMRSAVG